MTADPKSIHKIKPGGSIIVRDADGTEAQIDLPIRLGDGIPGETVVSTLLSVLEKEYGRLELAEQGKEYDELSGWPCWQDWENYFSNGCWLERRGEERYFGADGYFEQIVIGIVAAGGYEVIRGLACRIASSIRRQEHISNDAGSQIAEHRERIEGVLVPRYRLVTPLEIESMGEVDGLYHYLVTDAGDNECWAAVTEDGVLLSAHNG